MRLRTLGDNQALRRQTKLLIQRLLSPLCGLNTHINFISRERTEPRILTAGAELTGVHLLQGLPSRHRQGAHHIGGSGTFMNEVLIKIAGETIERYSQLTYAAQAKEKFKFASYKEMESRGEKIIPAEQLSFFTNEQIIKGNFPFQGFSADMPFSWVRAYSLISKESIWVPAQLIFVGYTVKSKLGEPWLFSAVTTGTASHTNYTSALRNALLELTQIDSAMGHWYGHGQAFHILWDTRTTIIEKFIKNSLAAGEAMPQFFWIKNADLAEFTIACVFENKTPPRVAIGLGADTRLIDAMHKAYLEAIGVASLAKLILINQELSNNSVDTQDIFDLDKNVALYARGGHYALFKEKFNVNKIISARDLPPDYTEIKKLELNYLIQKFSETKKELIYLDLTTDEAKQLGFVVSRVWSPDTLSLCLPSAVPKAHARFKNYGGVSHDLPHPYP